MNMRQTFVETTGDLLNDDPHLAVVLADISVALFRDSGAIARHPDRVINVGIREQAMVGVASGLALEGLRPVVHTYAPFLVERPFEQIKLDLSHQGVGAVLVSIGATFDAASSGRTHQALGDVAILRTLPDWTIHVPGHSAEVEILLRHAAAREGNVYLRLTDSSNAQPRAIEPGRLEVVRRGRVGAPTVVTVGPMLDPIVAALGDLDVTLVYCTTVQPLDTTTLRGATTGSEVILIEPYLEGTSTQAITRVLSDRPMRVLSIGVPAVEHRHYGSAAEHEAAHGLDRAGLRERIARFLQKPE